MSINNSDGEVNFNLREVYEKEIKEKIEELELLCNRNKIPMFFCAALSDSENETEYVTKVLQPLLYNYELHDDKFADFINVMNGFTTYYKPKVESVDEDDFTKILKGVMKDDE